MAETKRVIADPRVVDPARSRAAKRAWETMKSAPYGATQTARLSQEALRTWAASNSFHLVFLDAPSGKPRTGIVDALLIKIGRQNPDELEIHLVQLKGGGAGLTPEERNRIAAAVLGARIGAALAMWDRKNMAVDFLAASPMLTVEGDARKRKSKKR